MSATSAYTGQADSISLHSFLFWAALVLFTKKECFVGDDVFESTLVSLAVYQRVFHVAVVEVRVSSLPLTLVSVQRVLVGIVFPDDQFLASGRQIEGLKTLTDLRHQIRGLGLCSDGTGLELTL